MDFLRFGSGDWDLDSMAPPWGNRPAIFDAIRSRSPGELRSLPLPDEELVRKSNSVGWAPGALDGAFGHHAGQASSEDAARRILEQVVDVTERISNERVAGLYRTLESVRAMDVVDALLEAVVARQQWHEDRLYALAEWLARGAPNREAVKIGVALVGLFRDRDSEELLLTIGRHEEFTLFAAVALVNTKDNAETALWRLAQEVTGWGRIHLIERLADTSNEHVQSWLLRFGCENDIMREYTALICAQTGRLHDALAIPGIDAPLRNGARVILSALVAGRGGPAAGIEAYDAGPSAVRRFVDVLATGDSSLQEFLFLHDLAAFLKDDSPDFGSADARWTDARAYLGPKLAAMLEPSLWRERVLAALQRDGDDFWAASEAGRRLGMDVWESHFRRLQRGEDEWYAVMQTDDRSRVEQVVRYAEATLPLDDIASGPADEFGLGSAFQAHSALEFVLQDLRRFPGVGGQLVLVGLRSPVVRGRNMAGQVLEAWPRSEWPEGADELLRAAVASEPIEATRELLAAVLSGVSRADAS